MSDYWQTAEPLVHQSRIKIPYSWKAGETASYFFIQLRDHKKIWGKRCPKCNKVLLPPRKNCPFCFVTTEEWVEVRDEGKVETFTVVRQKTSIQPQKIPFVYAVIKLFGADTGFLHMLGEVDLEKIQEGMSVKAVYAEERKGEILDIKYFKPL